MATPIDFHLVMTTHGGADRCVGAVVDPAELATLQSNPDAMPIAGRLVAARGIEVDGEVFILSSTARGFDFPNAVPEFTVAGHDAKAAKVDAAIASLDADERERLAPWWTKPEAELKADRAREREAVKAEMEAAAAPAMKAAAKARP